MLLIRMIFFVMAYLMIGSAHAQNLLPTHISTSPYYFNAQPYMYPQMSQPYALPNYWQQQQPSFMNYMPALTQIASMVESDLGPSRNGEVVDDDRERDDRRSGRKDYTVDKKFTFNEDYKAPTYSSKTRSRTSTPRPDDDCEACRQNQQSQPTVLSTEATDNVEASIDVADATLSEELRAYQSSSGVRTMITYMRNQAGKHRTSRRTITGSKPKRKPLGRCLMYVKFGLKEGGYFRNYPSGMNASQFGPSLKQQGFTNIMSEGGYSITDPRKAPVGSIIVYEKTQRPGTPGHIEVKAGENEFISDFISDKPISESSSERRVIGIYAKLPEEGS